MNYNRRIYVSILLLIVVFGALYLFFFSQEYEIEHHLILERKKEKSLFIFVAVSEIDSLKISKFAPKILNNTAHQFYQSKVPSNVIIHFYNNKEATNPPDSVLEQLKTRFMDPTGLDGQVDYYENGFLFVQVVKDKKKYTNMGYAPVFAPKFEKTRL